MAPRLPSRSRAAAAPKAGDIARSSAASAENAGDGEAAHGVRVVQDREGYWTMRRAVVLAVVLALGGGAAAAEKDAKLGTMFNILIGGRLLSQPLGIAPEGIPDSSEDETGYAVHFSVLQRRSARWAWGGSLELEGSRVEVGPTDPIAGNQVFGIASTRLVGLAEYRYIVHERTAYFAWWDAGWAFNRPGVKIEWIGAPPPSGVAVGLAMDDSPTFGLGLGYQRRLFTMRFGYKWNRGSYRMTFAGGEDRTGDFDLSGFSLLLGVLLPP